jgi:peroxiredoxin
MPLLSIQNLQETMAEMTTNRGATVAELAAKKPVMLIFLRHFGCIFCREALTDIANRQKSIEQCGVKMVFVHMAENDLADGYFDNYELPGATHVSDPEQRYYRAFGLGKGTFSQLYGLRTWIRGFDAGLFKGTGHEFGSHLGDHTQMPGIFIIQDGQIKESYVHKLSSDRPDYVRLAKCCAV